MAEPVDSLIEVREELIVSPNGNGDGNPVLRKAHFLKPTVSSVDYAFPEMYSSYPSDPSNLPLKVNFEGWRMSQHKWKLWVDRMKSRHGSTWKKVGIYDAILSSTYLIRRNDGLIFGVAEKWCLETNTFIFPWGEVTITLEDMMVLMGFSVLGDPVLSPLETAELKEVEAKLVTARLEMAKTKARKVCHYLWLKKFLESEDEIEHEAFLALWLSRFVFPICRDTIRQCVFPIAIHLARGTTIALAPAVLAHIYRDLSILKRKIVSLSEFQTGESKDKENNNLTLTLWSPFYLVQIWLWERFLEFRPRPNSLTVENLRAARWSNTKIVRAENVRLHLDMAGESFQWRLCANVVNKSCFPKLYRELGMWVSVDEHLDDELKSFARCLRVSELLGLDCIEQYLPHRVSRQFGYDQDIPGSVVRFNETARIAWKQYSKPMNNLKLYIPSRSFKADVTATYFEWWKQSAVVCKIASKKGMQCQRRLTSFRGKKGGNKSYIPGDFAAKSVEEDYRTLAELLYCNSPFKTPCGGDNEGAKYGQSPMNPDEIVILSDATTRGSEKSQRSSKDGGDSSCIELKGENDTSAHPESPSKCNEAESVNQEEDELTIAELLLRYSNKHDNSGVRRGCSSAHSDGHNMDSLTKPVKKVMHWVVEMGGSQCVVKDVVHQVQNSEDMKRGSEGEGGMNSNEEHTKKLVARISRLERLVVLEKTARSRLGEQPFRM